jgi:hypothetical protein
MHIAISAPELEYCRALLIILFYFCHCKPGEQLELMFQGLAFLGASIHPKRHTFS